MKIILKNIQKRSNREVFLSLKFFNKKKNKDNSLIFCLLKIFERKKSLAFQRLQKERKDVSGEVKRMGELLFGKVKKDLIISLMKSKQNKHYIYEGTNKINVALISAIYKRKINVLNELKTLYFIPYYQRSSSVQKLYCSFEKIFFKKAITSFQKLK